LLYRANRQAAEWHMPVPVLVVSSRKHGVPHIHHQPKGQGRQTALSSDCLWQAMTTIQSLDQAEVGEAIIPFDSCLCFPYSSSLTLVSPIPSPRDTTSSHHTNSIVLIPAKTEQEGATALRPASPKTRDLDFTPLFPALPPRLAALPCARGPAGALITCSGPDLSLLGWLKQELACFSL
jgi:hypothetical protein